MYSVRTDGTGLVTLKDLGIYHEVSNYTGKILIYNWTNQFTSNDPGQEISIWTMNPDGTDRKLLLQAQPDWYPFGPIWSPDGSQIAYQRMYLAGDYTRGAEVNRSELWTMQADGSNHHLVYSDESFILGGAMGVPWFFHWMRNGYIYFVNFDKDLYAVDPTNGKPFWIQGNVEFTRLLSAFSPSGVHSRADPWFQSMGFTALSSPNWSWDGSKLIDVVGQDVWITDIASGQRLKAAASIPEGAKLLPASPDYRFIAYLTGEGLYTVNIEEPGAQPVLLANDPHSDIGPLRFYDWLPVR
jgi:hypothetical protein